MPVLKQQKPFDLSSLIPQSVQDFASNYTPEPIKKAAKFGFETFVPQDTNDQIGSFISPLPLSTALNIPKKTLKTLSEELLDTLPSHIYEKKKQDVVKDILAKHPATGYLGGEGNVISSSISDEADQMLNKGKSITGVGSLGMYQGLFDTGADKKAFSNLMKVRGDDADVVKHALESQRRYKPAIALNEPILTESGMDRVLNHELRHLGQDVAPEGILSKTQALEKKYVKFMKERGIERDRLPHSLRPQELLISAHKSSNPDLAGLRFGERLQKAMNSKYVDPFLGQNKGEQEFFFRHILSMLQSYGQKK